MLKNARQIPTTVNPVVTPKNASEFTRAVTFIRLGAIDACNEAPFHADYDRWSQKDQSNYESGRQDTINAFGLVEERERRALAAQIVAEWPADYVGIPPLINKLIGVGHMKFGNPFLFERQAPDENVEASVSDDNEVLY